jgi:hypothetical protein
MQRNNGLLGRGGAEPVQPKRPPLPVYQVVVARDPAVVLVDLAVPFSPLVVRPLGNAHPGEELSGRRLGLVGPVADVIDYRVARFVGNPDAV